MDVPYIPMPKGRGFTAHLVKAEDLEAVAIEDGMIGMKQDGIVKASLGYLELAELMKIF